MRIFLTLRWCQLAALGLLLAIPASASRTSLPELPPLELIESLAEEIEQAAERAAQTAARAAIEKRIALEVLGLKSQSRVGGSGFRLYAQLIANRRFRLDFAVGDRETGLYYAKARFYDPLTGRFLSRDPVQGSPMNPPSLHRYLYAYGNPTVYVDPTGRIAWIQALRDKAEKAADDLAENATDSSVNIRAVGRTALRIAAKGLGIANQVVNGAAIVLAPDSKSGREAEAEQGEIGEAIRSTVLSALDKVADVVVEDPTAILPKVAKAGKDAVVSVVKSALETTVDLFSKDPKRRTRALSDVLEVGVGVLAGEVLAAEMAVARPAGKLLDDVVDRPSRPVRTSSTGPPDASTGAGYGVTDPPVRIEGDWTINDLKQGLLGHPPRGLESPDLHHAEQMPGSAIHEITPDPHRKSSALHPNRFNQGVTPAMREADRQLHWWYRAREQGADELLPDWIFDDD